MREGLRGAEVEEMGGRGAGEWPRKRQRQQG